jgi:hypothetical protein
MRLKWIAAVGDKENNASAWLESADHFADSGAVIRYVFKDLVAEDQIESRGRERKNFSCRVDDVQRISPCFRGALEIIFQPDNFPTKGREVLNVHADSTSIFENTSLNAFPRGADDQFQTALLACPPHVGGFAA